MTYKDKIVIFEWNSKAIILLKTELDNKVYLRYFIYITMRGNATQIITLHKVQF